MTESKATRLEIAVLVATLLATAGYLARMLSYPARAGTVPAIVASVTLAAVVFELVRVVRTRGVIVAGDAEPSDPTGEITDLGSGGLKRLGLVVMWILVLFAAIAGLGFVVGPGLMGFVLMRIERETWSATAIVTALLVGVAYLLMVVVLRAPVIDGAVFEWLGFD